MHHYFLFFIFLTLVSFQNPMLTIVHGFFNGGFIEGGARWGFDPVWIGSEVPFRNDRSKKREVIFEGDFNSAIRLEEESLTVVLFD